MLLTRKTDYALVAMAGLAEADGCASARELADQLHLPLPVLRNILKQLASAGMLSSTRGPSGGYRLARDPEQINLAEVMEVIEGPMQLARCCSIVGDEEPHCRLEDSCLIKERVRGVHDQITMFLKDVTLATILSDAAVTPGLTMVGIDDTDQCDCARKNAYALDD